MRLLVILLLAAAAQAPAPQTAVTEVRAAVGAARKETDAYAATRAPRGTADDPALKWDAAFWAWRDRDPRGEAAAIASAEAVRLLVRAELWDRAHARLDSLDANDPAWDRVSQVVYEEGIARNDLPAAIARLSRVAAESTTPTVKAAMMLVVGRAQRRLGDKAAATRALETAKAAAPGTPQAEEADGLIYEITHLSPGDPAPPFSTKARNGRTVDLKAYRGKSVVIVFWGST